MFRRAVLAWLCFVFIAGLLAAQPKPSSDLLLPWFEVDLEGGEATTVFAVVNALNKQVDVAAALYTNWGLPVISTQIRLKPGEVLTADLRAWIVEGHLPGNKSLTAGEMLLVQALLSGQPSPSDGLYHATDVALGRATGYLTLRTLRTGGKKGAKPDALRGEGFLVDPAQGPARGHDLVDIDKATTKEVCNRHNLRHLSGTGLAEARMIVWRDLTGQILPVPAPVDRRRQIDVSVYAADGKLLRNQSLQLLPAEQVPVTELGLAEPLGRIEIATAEASVTVIQDSAGGPLFETSCVQTGSNPGPTPDPKAAVQIATLVNGQEASSPPGPSIPNGSTVTWSYRVTNSGSDPLTQISVHDDQGVAATCPKGTLNPGQSLTCTARATAQSCQQRNVGTVTARIKKGKKEGSTVTAQDPGHYFGEDGAAIDIVTSTNGMDANVPTGPSVLAGSPVSWTYLVTNTGKVRLLSVRVSDDRGAAVVCPRTSLDPGEAMTCEAAGVAAAGQFGNVATVTGSATCGEVSDSDPSHYFGESEKSVQLRALVNGFDADVPPGPSVPAGSPVTWEYVVTNSGKFPLNGLAVSDDKGTAVSCPKAGLTAGESMTCIARGVASSCQNAAFASVTGQTPDGTQVAASNPAYYFGQAEAGIRIESSVNGDDADSPPGPAVSAGLPISWTYMVVNTGKVALNGVAVTDGFLNVTCPKTELRPGESMICSASGTAAAGQFIGLARATGEGACGSTTSDDDPGHYFGQKGGTDDTAPPMQEDSPATAINVLANDGGVGPGSFKIIKVTKPQHGTAAIIQSGAALTYKPDPNYCNETSGPDFFTYTNSPGNNILTVAVTVTCVDDPPVAVNDLATINENGEGLISAAANDTDVDGGPKSIDPDLITEPAHGTATVVGSTVVRYVPDQDYCNSLPGDAPDVFAYALSPGGSTATMAVTVNCVGDPPTAVDDEFQVQQDSGHTLLDVLANDVFSDPAAKEILSVLQPANGTVIIQSDDAKLTYQPDANYCNDTTPDSFTYTIPGGATATVEVTVNCNL